MGSMGVDKGEVRCNIGVRMGEVREYNGICSENVRFF